MKGVWGCGHESHLPMLHLRASSVQSKTNLESEANKGRTYIEAPTDDQGRLYDVEDNISVPGLRLRTDDMKIHQKTPKTPQNAIQIKEKT